VWEEITVRRRVRKVSESGVLHLSDINWENGSYPLVYRPLFIKNVRNVAVRDVRTVLKPHVNPLCNARLGDKTHGNMTFIPRDRNIPECQECGSSSCIAPGL